MNYKMCKCFSVFFILFIAITNVNAEVKVLSATPMGKVQGRDTVDNIVVVFNQPMVPLEKLPEGDGSGPLELSPEVNGKYRWKGTNTLVFTPSSPLQVASEYKATVNSGFKSEVSGEILQANYIWKFETLRPALQQSVPNQNDCWVELDRDIILIFNQEMNPERAINSISLIETTAEGNNHDLKISAFSPTDEYFKSLNRQYYYLSQKKAETIIVVRPEQKFCRDCSYKIKLQQGMLGKTGTLGLLETRQIEFQTYLTFKFIKTDHWDNLDPTGGINFIFTNPVKYSDLIKNIETKPEIKFSQYYSDSNQFSWGNCSEKHSSLEFNVELNPDTEYWIKIKGELSDKYGQQLGQDIEFTFHTADYPSRMQMPNGLGVVEKYMKPLRHPLTLTNVKAVRLQMAVINPDSFIQVVNGNPFSSSNPFTPEKGFSIDRIVDTKIVKNKRILYPLSLQEVLKDKQAGIIYLQVDAMENLAAGSQYRQALLQVTSMGITGKFSPDNNLVYVSYLKTGNPVMDCSIELRDNKNKVLWSGKTDKRGFVKTPGWEELNIIPEEYYRKPKFWIIARKGDDTAISSSDWVTGIYPYSFGLNYEYSPKYPKYGGHIFTERGIYRPGEIVYIKGIIRERKQGKWELPRINDYELVIKDSREAEVLKADIALSDFGSFDYKMNINKTMPTGYYNVNLNEKINSNKKSNSGYKKIDFSTYFRVEEYKLATFEVNVKLDQPEYILGDTATVKMQGWYLFGAPMPGMDLEYAMRFKRSYFNPEGYAGYVFSSYWGEDEGRYWYSPGTVISGNTKLDDEGKFSFSSPLISRGFYGTLEVIAEGTVTSPDRQRLSGWKKSVVHGGEFYIGLKPLSSFIEKGKDFQLDIITVLPSGEMCSGNEVFCQLIRREWNSVRKAGVGGRLEWVTEKKEVTISSFTVTSAKSPFSWQYTPDKSGFYYFIALSKDKRGNLVKSSVYFYITGKDYCAWERSDDDKLNLICDKERYKPGETVKILVKSPYEKAKAVVTLEREGIIDQWITDVVGSADTVTVPLNYDHIPNVYVCVMLYQGRIGETQYSEEGLDLSKPSFKIGYTNIIVDPGDKHLIVKTESDKKSYKPGDEVKVKLNVSDTKSNGLNAEVTVAVVDIGVLNLINYQTPDSFIHFYGPKPLSVDTSETRINIIGQRNYGEKGENRGGGGGREFEFDLRSKFIPTAYWNPKVITNNDGTAEVSFVLPDNLSAFRIMASAHTKDSMFGAGDSRITVSKPLLLKPSLPRFANDGDKFSAGVLCHNNTQQDGTVTVKVNTTGIKLVGSDTQDVFVEKGSAKEVKFDFIADNIGQAEFEFRAIMGNEKDGLKWSLPIKTPRPTEAVATYASTLIEAKEGIKIPSNIFDESSYIDISLAPTALIGVKGGLEYLFKYPYGCLEQKTSKILPLILAGDFIDKFNLAPFKENTARELITDYLANLRNFQTDSGGFAFWNRGIPSPYLTSYVLWAIGEAKKNGYAVEDQVIRYATDYLRAYLRGDKRGWDWPYSINAELCTKAFSAYALSVNGAHEQGIINELYKRIDQMPLFGKIYLMKAMKSEKMSSTYLKQITDSVYNNIKVAPTEAHFEEPSEEGMDWIWHTNTRTTAAILQGLLEVNEEFPQAEKIARWLASQRKSGRWVSTQENLYVFYAFNEYVKYYEKESPEFTAQVLFSAKEIMNESFSGRTLSSRNKKLEVKGYERDVQIPVAFKKTGTGRLYYEFRMVYAPKGDFPPRNEGINIEKTIIPFKNSVMQDNTYNMGGRYIVKLKISTDQERKFVVVDDPLPAGFEVVNLSFANESQSDAENFRKDTRDDNYRYWGTFSHWENYDDRVLLFSDFLNRGEHSYSYLIQATTPGEFFMPAAKVEEMYTPEVFGRTEQKNIIIK